MSTLWLQVRPEGGSKISDAIKDAKRIVDSLSVTVYFEFSGRTIIVHEKTNVDELISQWYERVYNVY